MDKINTSNQFYFQWHFLNSCNLRCKHCYQQDYNPINDMSFNILKQIADKITDTLIKWNMFGRVSLTGGEPFISNNFHQLFSYLNANFRICSINILTNGTCISDDDIDFLKSMTKLDQIQISLDGGNSTIHDMIRGKGNFDKTIHIIRKLKKNNFKVALMFTLQEYNKNNYNEFIDLAIKENVDYITIERVTPCSNDNKFDILSAEEVKAIYTEITKRANEIIDKPIIRRSRPLWINTKEFNTQQSCNIGGFCPVGLTALTILHDGTILPCRRLNIPIGNILKDSIYKIWYTSNVLWNIRNKNNLKGKCHNCINLSYCGGCRAIAYAVTNNYMESDPQCWIKN